MLISTELRNGTVFRYQGETWIVKKYDFIKTGRGSGTVKVKVMSLTTGSIVIKGFNINQKFEEASIEKKSSIYMYSDDQDIYLMDAHSFEQFSMPKSLAPETPLLFREGEKFVTVFLDEKPISLEYPKTVCLKVISEGGNAKGDSSSKTTKDAKLETGLSIKVPLFIKTGDTIKINTEDLTYIERA